MSKTTKRKVNQLFSDRLLKRDYVELISRVTHASKVSEDYYIYLQIIVNTKRKLDSTHMSHYVDRIVEANKRLWRLLKLFPNKNKDQYKAQKDALIETLQTQLAAQIAYEKEQIFNPEITTE